MRRSNFIVKFFYTIINLLTLNATFIVGFALRFIDVNVDQIDLFQSQQYHILLLFLNLVMIIFSVRDHVFTEFETISARKVFRTIVIDSLSIILSLFMFIVVLKGYQYSRQFHLLFAIFLFMGLALSRYAFLAIINNLMWQRLKNRRILLIADKHTINRLLVAFDAIFSNSRKLVKVFVNGIDEPIVKDGVVLNPANGLDDDINPSKDEIILYYNDRSADFFGKVIDNAENLGVRVRIIPGFFAYRMSDIVVDYDYTLPLLRFRPEPLENINNYILKRIFDIFFSLLVLLIVYPIIFLIIAPLIKLSSRGPIFF